MSSFVLGSSTAGYLRLPVRVPLDGAHYESIHVLSQSLSGVTTMNRRALKRRWQLPLKILDNIAFTALMNLWRNSAGPYWLWDGSVRLADAPEPFTPSTANGWFYVLIEDLSESHPNKLMHAPTLSLREA